MSGHRLPKDWLSAPWKVADPGNAGTVNLDNKGKAIVSIITTGAETRTIPAPDVVNQVVTVYLDTDGGNATVAITGGQGISSVVLDDAGDAFTLVSISVAGTAKWIPAWASGPLSGFPSALGGNVTVPGTLGVTGVTTPTGGIAAAGGFTATPCGAIHTGGIPARVSTDGTELTPGATTTAYVVEIFIPCNMTITGVNHFNGSAVTGNITVGLYTSAGVAIPGALSAATAGSGTDAYQAIPFATPYAAVGPAKYLLVFQYSSTSARPNTHTIGTVFSIAQTTVTVGTTAISPVPTAFTSGQAIIASLY